jgi:hypothetical protein
MSSARKRAFLFGLLLLLLLLMLVAVGASHWSRRPSLVNVSGRKPTLLMLTSLPLMFGEDFSLPNGGSPALQALQGRFRVAPIDVTSPAELAKGRLLLMAQPQAQTPDNLVALDEWVRRGGRLLLLADPLLEWPSNRPLGDPLRPPVMFVDTGLLAHWGLRLDAPERRGAALRQLGGQQVLTVSPGSLSGNCQISADRLVAECLIGRGRVTVVADADLLDIADLGPGSEHNLEAVLAELAQVDQK